MLPMRQFNPKMSSTRCIRSPVSKLPFTKSFPQLRIDVDRPGKKHHASPDPGQVPGVRSSRGTPALEGLERVEVARLDRAEGRAPGLLSLEGRALGAGRWTSRASMAGAPGGWPCGPAVVRARLDHN